MYLQGGCFLREGLAETGKQVCLPPALMDWGTCRNTSHPDRQAQPTDGHRVIHLVIVIHSSCRLRPEAVGGHLHLNFISRLTLPPLASLSEASREGHSRTVLFLNDFQNNYIG